MTCVIDFAPVLISGRLKVSDDVSEVGEQSDEAISDQRVIVEVSVIFLVELMTIVELGTEQVEREAEIKNQPCVQQDEPASIFE